MDGLIRLLDSGRAVGDVFNVGNGREEISILELAQRIVERTASDSEIELIPYEDAYESGFEDMRRRVPDTTKLEQLTGWQPKRSLNDILDAVITEARQELNSPTASA